MNIVLSGHYAQKYIISVDRTFVNCKACFLVKHAWRLPEAYQDPGLSKAVGKKGLILDWNGWKA